jgi:hypothetical protein
VLPNNPSLTINDLDDVKQIDGLFRAHVLLAELAGRSSPDYKDYLLQAHAYLIRLWQVSEVTVRLCLSYKTYKTLPVSLTLYPGLNFKLSLRLQF